MIADQTCTCEVARDGSHAPSCPAARLSHDRGADAAMAQLIEVFAVQPPRYGHSEECAYIRYPGSHDQPPDPCTCYGDLIRAALSVPAPTLPALDAAWAEAEAALPENGWLTVGTVGPGLVTVEAFHWPEGKDNRSVARAFKMPMLEAVLSVRDQLREALRDAV